jgi:YVTN family beta-propeller protein
MFAARNAFMTGVVGDGPNPLTVTTTITGVFPSSFSLSPDGTKLYSTRNNNFGNMVTTSTNAVSQYTVRTAAYLGQSIGVKLSPNGSRAYFGYLEYNSSFTQIGTNLMVLDTSNNTISATITVGTTPTCTAFLPDGSKAYVTNNVSNSVSVINTSNNTVSATISVGSAPWGIAMSPDGTKAYVANGGGNSVSVINTSNNTVSDTITGFGSQVRHLICEPTGTKVYVGVYGSNTVKVINTSSNTIASTITVGTTPWELAVSPDGAKVYVASSGSGTVSVIDTSSDTVANTINVSSAQCVAVSPDGTKLYVGEYNTGTVSVIT